MEVAVPGDGDHDQIHRGVNLDDVLRAVVWDILQDHGWGVAEAARRFGIPQRTLADFLDVEKMAGMRVDTMSRICAGMRLTPVDLLRRHELYQPELDESRTRIDESAYDRLRGVFTPTQASRVARIVEILKDRRVLQKTLEVLEAMLGVKSTKLSRSENGSRRQA